MFALPAQERTMTKSYQNNYCFKIKTEGSFLLPAFRPPSHAPTTVTLSHTNYASPYYYIVPTFMISKIQSLRLIFNYQMVPCHANNLHVPVLSIFPRSCVLSTSSFPSSIFTFSCLIHATFSLQFSFCFKMPLILFKNEH